jgi:hypothetical protein
LIQPLPINRNDAERRLINALDEDADGALSASAKCVRGRLLFGKIWERLGIADVLCDLSPDYLTPCR